MSQMATPNANQTIHPGAGQKPAPNVDMARVKYGAWLVGAAFALLGVVFGIAVSQFTTTADVTAAPFVTFIGLYTNVPQAAYQLRVTLSPSFI